MAGEREEALRWLEKAEEDLDDARYMLEDSREETAGFLLQQAVEKGLKAVQIADRGEYDRTHNLVELGKDIVPSQYLQLLGRLNPAYTGFRYPDIDASIENVEDRLKEVEELLSWIRKQLNA